MLKAVQTPRLLVSIVQLVAHGFDLKAFAGQSRLPFRQSDAREMRRLKLLFKPESLALIPPQLEFKNQLRC